MRLGESWLAIVAVVLFTVGALQLNAMRLDSRARLWETEFRASGLTVAQSFLEQAQVLNFDETLVGSVGSLASLPAGLTAPDSLGPDPGELGIDQFDDIDDFHGYSQVLRTPRAEFHVHMTTTYADSSSLAPGVERSLLKWLHVAVASPFYRDTLRVHYLYATR